MVALNQMYKAKRELRVSKYSMIHNFKAWDAI